MATRKPKFVTPRRAAQILGCSYPTIINYIRLGKLHPRVKRAGCDPRYFIRRADVLALPRPKMGKPPRPRCEHCGGTGFAPVKEMRRSAKS